MFWPASYHSQFFLLFLINCQIYLCSISLLPPSLPPLPSPPPLPSTPPPYFKSTKPLHFPRVFYFQKPHTSTNDTQDPRPSFFIVQEGRQARRVRIMMIIVVNQDVLIFSVSLLWYPFYSFSSLLNSLTLIAPHSPLFLLFLPTSPTHISLLSYSLPSPHLPLLLNLTS